MTLQRKVQDDRVHISRIRFKPFSTALVSLLTGLLASGSQVVCASDPAPDKSSFHFFNPTPRSLMRELSTDRPDKTESAYTVDAGHFQIESDL